MTLGECTSQGILCGRFFYNALAQDIGTAECIENKAGPRGYFDREYESRREYRFLQANSSF